MTEPEPQTNPEDPRYATVTMRSTHLREIFRAWVEELDVDLEETHPDAHDTPLGAWQGDETTEAVAWFRDQAADRGVENLEPLPEAEEGDS